VYVEPDVELETLGNVGLGETHDHSVARLFEELCTSLTAPGDVTVETMLLRGDPAATVLDHASRDDVDLIAAGTQGRVALERHLTGSVSTAILRGARCPVLIAPPPRGSS
jgi:nucleotide-binding universal stress UspA family protein